MCVFIREFNLSSSIFGFFFLRQHDNRGAIQKTDEFECSKSTEMWTIVASGKNSAYKSIFVCDILSHGFPVATRTGEKQNWMDDRTDKTVEYSILLMILGDFVSVRSALFRNEIFDLNLNDNRVAMVLSFPRKAILFLIGCSTDWGEWNCAWFWDSSSASSVEIKTHWKS